MNQTKPSTVLITGGGTGLGLEIARQLVVHGYNILLIGRRQEVINSAVTELRTLQASTANLSQSTLTPTTPTTPTVAMENIKGYCGDVSNPQEMEALFARWHRDGVVVDVLVNNAGVISPISHLADSDIEAWKNILLVNTFGVYLMTRLALPGMLQRGGTVVNISSGSAHRPLEGWSAYCTSKAGMKMFTENLHLECADKGVRVFSYRPGMVDTPMQETIRHSGINWVSKVPREDLLSPEESARPAVWFIHSAPHHSEEYRGREMDIRDPSFREKIGLRSYT